MSVTSKQLRLLAGLLAKPEQESLEILQELAQEYFWLQPAVAQLASLALEQWQGEHTHLFVNGHPQTCCPPFESVYRNKIMNGPACEELNVLYKSIGLEPYVELPPDYLGMILECAAYLLEQEPLNQEVWNDLWHVHLLEWVPKFANDLQKCSNLLLYQQLGQQLHLLFAE